MLSANSTAHFTKAIAQQLAITGGQKTKLGACLEGAAMLGGHNVAHLLHHVTKPLHLFRTAESLPHTHKLLSKYKLCISPPRSYA